MQKFPLLSLAMCGEGLLTLQLLQKDIFFNYVFVLFNIKYNILVFNTKVLSRNYPVDASKQCS